MKWMLKVNNIVVSEYINDNLKAIIAEDADGYIVLKYDGDKLVSTSNEKALNMAEHISESWVAL